MDPRAVLGTFAQLSAPDAPSQERQQQRLRNVIDDPTLITPVGHVVEKLFDGGTVGGWSLQGFRRPPQTGRLLNNVVLDPSSEVLPGFPERKVQRTEGRSGYIDWPSNEERVLSVAALHSGEQRLRVGWVWFAGTVTIDDKRTQFCFPAISVPVERSSSRLNKIRYERPLSAAGDAEATKLISNEHSRSRLLADRDFGSGALGPATYGYDVRMVKRLDSMNRWIDEVAKAAGISIRHRRVIQDGVPTDFRSADGISMIVGSYLYISRGEDYHASSERLAELAKLRGIGDSAFAKIYGDHPLDESPTRRVEKLRPMSARQRQITSRALAQEISVLSGPPGTGKSHMVAVAALDAISRGKSVLVAASSRHAVDVLVQHFIDTPGPTPVVFSGSARSQDLADALVAHGSQDTSDDDRANPDARAITEVDRVTEEIRLLLLAGAVATRLASNPRDLSQADEHLARAGDLDDLEALIDQGAHDGLRGWTARRRSTNELAARLGNGEPSRKLKELRVLRAARTLVIDGGLTLSERLDSLFALETEAANQRGELITKAWISGLRQDERSALGEVAAAMSSSRADRRELLREMNPRRLLRAAPLWVGSVEDIDDVLPQRAAMFDLTILDEAAQIDQMDAPVALVRARSAIVVGDPHQLGHTLLLSNQKVQAAAEANGVNAERVNPNRDSVLDVAGAVGSTHVLNEHFRSAPHLIEFSARRIYGNSLGIVTRHPSNEAADHIDVHVVDGWRSAQKVNESEVAECLSAASAMIEAGHRSIGFVSPFRDQADAIEKAVLTAFSLDEIDDFGLRVGTVHSFQGDERDVIIASWAVGPDEPDRAWQFVNQPNLFNVMVTRARQCMAVVTSRRKPPGLAGEYVRWAEPLVDIVADEEIVDPWVHEVAGAFEAGGVSVRLGYRVGRHVVDLVAGDGDAAVAIDCRPHPDGADAHLDRGLMLRRMGWKTADCYESKWHDQLAQFVSTQLKI